MEKYEITPYERLMGVLSGDKVDRIPVAPIVREWCSTQVGFKFSEIMNSAEKYVYAQYYCARKFGTDAVWDLWGVHAEAEAMGTILKIPDNIACSVDTPVIKDYKEDLHKIKILDPTKDGRLPLIIQGVKMLKNLCGGIYPIMAYVQGPFRLASTLRGAENLMKDCMKKNKYLEELLEFCTDALIIYGTALIHAGADIIWIGDPTSSGNAISRNMWMQYGQPYTKRLVKSLKRNRIKILMHICGDTSDRLDTFVDTGIDAMSLDEKVDLGYAREVMGDDFCLWGNVSPSNTLFFKTPDEVIAETKSCIDKAKGKNGKLVICSGCMVPEQVPAENMIAMIDAVKKYGQIN